MENYWKTYVVHPALALLCKMSCTDRNHGIVVLEIMRIVPEEIDQAAQRNRNKETVRIRFKRAPPQPKVNSQLADALKVCRTPFFP